MCGTRAAFRGSPFKRTRMCTTNLPYLTKFLNILQDLLATGFANAPKLRSVHINYPLEDGTEASSTSPVLSSDEALEVVQHCGSTITEFGCNTRVWQVYSSLYGSAREYDLDSFSRLIGWLSRTFGVGLRSRYTSRHMKIRTYQNNSW
jgi:hypothetical protein